MRWPSWAIILAALALALAGVYEGQVKQHESCRRGIAERLTTIEESNVTITAAHSVVAAPNVPPGAKAAKSKEAAALEALRERRYKRVDPRHGGQLVCPTASIFPRL